MSTFHAEPTAPSCASTYDMTDPVSGGKDYCGLVWPVVYTVVAVYTDGHVCTYVCNVLNACKDAGHHSSEGEGEKDQQLSLNQRLAGSCNMLVSG